jgi:hypothetical protein
MIRKATQADLPGLLALSARAHGKSDWSRFPFRQEDAALFLLASMREKDMCCIVSDEGKLNGVIVGMQQPMPFNQRVTSATDVFTFSAKRGIAEKLVEAFHHWALNQRKVDEVFMMCSQARSEHWFGQILQRHGMRPVGRGFVRQP